MADAQEWSDADLNQRVRSMILANKDTGQADARPTESDVKTGQTASRPAQAPPKIKQGRDAPQKDSASSQPGATVSFAPISHATSGREQGVDRGGSSAHRARPNRQIVSGSLSGHMGSSRPRIAQNPNRARAAPQAASGDSVPARGSRGGAKSSLFHLPGRQGKPTAEQLGAQALYLEKLAQEELPKLEMTSKEFDSKEGFRHRVESVCCEVIASCHQTLVPPSLVAFGSLASGFAMPGSDMDLALITSNLSPDVPRLLERSFLDQGYGARLLTRTRVPILKLCEKPSPDLYDALCLERSKWEGMTPEEREEHDRGPAKKKDVDTQTPDNASGDKNTQINVATGASLERQVASRELGKDGDGDAKRVRGVFKHDTDAILGLGSDAVKSPTSASPNTPASQKALRPEHLQYTHLLRAIQKSKPETLDTWITSNPPPPDFDLGAALHSRPSERQHKNEKPWLREKPLGPLDFPKSSVGILCDINFSNPLGIHNTALLHAYATCDVRVRLTVLFVKLWAGRRKINSGYNGTLSSYGYVLMALHFLVNIASPPVCPNLQLWQTQKLEQTETWPLQRRYSPPDPADPMQLCEGADVRFHRNEVELANLAGRGLLTHNRAPLGVLLRDFFTYYATQGFNAPNGGFQWTRDVLSLRSPGGLMSKADKGWTGARTTEEEGGKEIRHRYLFAIEDPFEIGHNVARTVTHHGIVAIRDEFRRCARILEKLAKGEPHNEGALLEALTIEAPKKEESEKHGKEREIQSESPKRKEDGVEEHRIA